MNEKKYSPDSAEAFLRDAELHGEPPVKEAHIKALAAFMEKNLVTGTQARLECMRTHLTQHPEEGTPNAKSAPKVSLSDLRKMSPTQKLDYAHNVPTPTLDGLKHPK